MCHIYRTSALNWTDEHLLLITGATGFVGSHITRAAIKRGIRTRVLVNRESRFQPLQDAGVHVLFGGMTDPYSLKGAVADSTHIVHCASRDGNWGKAEKYHDVNVNGLETMLQAAVESDTLERFVHISSLDVYETRDHHGTDETEPTGTEGVDAYTLTRVEADELVQEYVRRDKLPAVILRPGFVYGPRDRTVLPHILTHLKSGSFRFVGSGEQLLNHVFVRNVVDAVFLALECENQIGEAFNITDGRLVSWNEFIGTICESAGYKYPEKHMPLPLARIVAGVLEAVWRAIGKTEPPTPSTAMVKFLGYHLDFSIDKAKHELGYDPQVDFVDAIKQTISWARKAGLT